MSDMIKHLDDLAQQVGADAGDRLSMSVTNARLASEVRRGLRRRRIIAASVTAATVVVVGAAAIVVPQLMKPTPIAPAGEVRTPIETTDGLITYSDGSMQVLTSSGHTVNVPPAGEDAPVFRQQSHVDACALDPSLLTAGWVPQFPGAFDLVSFARPLSMDSEGAHVLAQGQTVHLDSEFDYVAFAFSVDVDPAIADKVVMTLDSYVLAVDGRVGYIGSQLESEPTITYSGDKAAGTYTATLTTRAMATYSECPGVGSYEDLPIASGVSHYMQANVFVNDGHGHVNPIATHNSWVTIVKASS
ncbi:hypothetical protein [Demequina sp.]|uniref:hypothetical protein n=1 Tax=Demequina sp. TaxID=2050685 RepID=UPI003D12E52E